MRIILIITGPIIRVFTMQIKAEDKNARALPFNFLRVYGTMIVLDQEVS